MLDIDIGRWMIDIGHVIYILEILVSFCLTPLLSIDLLSL